MKFKNSYKKSIFFVLICCLTFLLFYYIFKNIGNNIFNKENADIIVEKILNQYINYEANAKIMVKSNKTENEYLIFQKVNDKESLFEIDELGIVVNVYDDKFIVRANKINLEKQILLDDNNLINNNLFLNVLIKEYNNPNIRKTIKENDLNEIELEIEVNNNTYCSKKILYINKATNKPDKLIVKDNQGNERIIILYNDIKIN